jgi:hypothetical protein
VILQGGNDEYHHPLLEPMNNQTHYTKDILFKYPWSSPAIFPIIYKSFNKLTFGQLWVKVELTIAAAQRGKFSIPFYKRDELPIREVSNRCILKLTR